jgi:hypothetical protein
MVNLFLFICTKHYKFFYNYLLTILLFSKIINKNKKKFS